MMRTRQNFEAIRIPSPSPESEPESASLSKIKNYLFDFNGRSQPKTDKSGKKSICNIVVLYKY